MRKFVVSLSASVVVLAAGLATVPATAVPFPASVVMPQDAAPAHGTVIPAGPRYLYGSQYYRYYDNRPYYRRSNGHGSYYPGYRKYRPYYAPLSICGTMLCYRPKYFITPLW